MTVIDDVNPVYDFVERMIEYAQNADNYVAMATYLGKAQGAIDSLYFLEIIDDDERNKMIERLTSVVDLVIIRDEIT